MEIEFVDRFGDMVFGAGSHGMVRSWCRDLL